MKHFVSVLAGFLVWTVLFLVGNQVLFRVFRDRFSDDMVTTDTTVLGVTLALTVLYSLIAGFVTARLAPRRPIVHGVALGVVQTAIGIAVQSAYWNVIPGWYHVAFIGMLFPATVAGAALWSQRNPHKRVMT